MTNSSSITIIAEDVRDEYAFIGGCDIPFTDVFYRAVVKSAELSLSLYHSHIVKMDQEYYLGEFINGIFIQSQPKKSFSRMYSDVSEEDIMEDHGSYRLPHARLFADNLYKYYGHEYSGAKLKRFNHFVMVSYLLYVDDFDPSNYEEILTGYSKSINSISPAPESTIPSGEIRSRYRNIAGKEIIVTEKFYKSLVSASKTALKKHRKESKMMIDSTHYFAVFLKDIYRNMYNIKSFRDMYNEVDIKDLVKYYKKLDIEVAKDFSEAICEDLEQEYDKERVYQSYLFFVISYLIYIDDFMPSNYRKILDGYDCSADFLDI